MHGTLIAASIQLRPNDSVSKRGHHMRETTFIISVCFLFHDLLLACSIACDNSTAFPGCQERKIFSSSHLSNWRNVWRDTLV